MGQKRKICFSKSYLRSFNLCVYLCIFSYCLFHPSGEYFHSGLWWHVPRDQPWTYLCLRLHLLWHHSQWHAHLSPLQQILWLLHQAQGPWVHYCDQGSWEGGLCQEGSKEVLRVLRWHHSPKVMTVACRSFKKRITNMCLWHVWQVPDHTYCRQYLKFPYKLDSIWMNCRMVRCCWKLPPPTTLFWYQLGGVQVNRSQELYLSFYLFFQVIQLFLQIVLTMFRAILLFIIELFDYSDASTGGSGN